MSYTRKKAFNEHFLNGYWVIFKKDIKIRDFLKVLQVMLSSGSTQLPLKKKKNAMEKTVKIYLYKVLLWFKRMKLEVLLF